MRAFSGELRVPKSEWSNVVPYIQSVIIKSPSCLLDNREPIEVHTDIKPASQLSIALASFKTRSVYSAEQFTILHKLEIDEVLQALDQIHKSFYKYLSTYCTQAVDCHNAKTHVLPFIFVVGDYVFVAQTRGLRTKMLYNWIGSCRITKVLSNFTVEF